MKENNDISKEKIKELQRKSWIKNVVKFTNYSEEQAIKLYEKMDKEDKSKKQ